MIEIMTIRDFMALPMEQQQEIQKALRVKDRLDDWLRGLNGKKTPLLQPEWRPCRVCSEEYPGWVLHTPRNDSDVHPSQITKCLKKLWFDCAGFATQMEEFIEPRLRMIFDLGHAWHHTVQGYGRAGAWCEKQYYRDEVPIDPNALGPDGTPLLPVAHHYWIRGSADAIIDRYIIPNVPTLGDVAVRMVHEYKTINEGQFVNLKRPKSEHQWQATIYSAVFDIPLVCYLYLNKNNCNQVDFPVPFNHRIWKEIQDKIDKLRYYIEADKMPPWEETSAVLNESECASCGYNKICKPKGR